MYIFLSGGGEGSGCCGGGGCGDCNGEMVVMVVTWLR